MLKEIDFELMTSEENIHFIEYDTSFFKINSNTFQLLSLIKQNKNIEEIAKSMKVEERNIRTALLNVTDTLTKRRQPKKIKHIFDLFKSNVCDFFGNKLQFLFGQKIFSPLLILSVAFSVTFYSLYADFTFLKLRVGFVEYIYSYFIIVLIHELGHVCAAYYYGIKGLKVSVGAYFIWPVFFVELNRQILLTRKKRIIVSSGGIYFQMLLTLFCLFLYTILQNDFILLIVNLNHAVVLLNILPILILDGYWIYSDFYRIENLNNKAKELTKKSVFKIKNIIGEPPALIFYALLRLLSFTLLYVFVTYILMSRIKYFPDMIALLQEGVSFMLILRIVWLLLPYALMLFYISKLIYGEFKRNT
jgi:putative peptide zinc metalloprotease protein